MLKSTLFGVRLVISQAFVYKSFAVAGPAFDLTGAGGHNFVNEGGGLENHKNLYIHTKVLKVIGLDYTFCLF